jgi:hypothetical protein
MFKVLAIKNTARRQISQKEIALEKKELVVSLLKLHKLKLVTDCKYIRL